MLEDVELHNANHEPSVIGANKLMETFVPKMAFNEDDLIMDIGCAAGDNTKNIFLRRIPKLKKLIAIDIIPKMIDFARLHFADEKIEYHVADIQDKSSFEEWDGSVSKIFSVYCFHWVKDQRRGFQTMYDLLRSKGEAVILFMLSSSLWDCYPSIINNEKWNKYLKDVDQYVPDSYHLHLGSDYFQNLFQDLGFEVIICEEESKIFPVTDEIKYNYKAHSALTKHIPDELKDEFAEDLLNEARKLHRISEGDHILRNQVLTVHLKKP